MARSLKKGPFVDDHLMKKVEQMNAANDRRSSRPGRAAPRSPRRWSGTPWPSTTAGSSSPSTSPRTWWATSSASSRPPGSSRATPRKVEKVATTAKVRAAGRRRGRGAREGIGHARSQGHPKYIRTSAQKAGLVLDLIRGKKAADALAILRFTKKSVARRTSRRRCARPSPTPCTWRTRTRSAGWTRTTSWSRLATRTRGPSQKRVRPAPMGRAYQVMKRTTHLTVHVSEREK